MPVTGETDAECQSSTDTAELHCDGQKILIPALACDFDFPDGAMGLLGMDKDPTARPVKRAFSRFPSGLRHANSDDVVEYKRAWKQRETTLEPEEKAQTALTLMDATDYEETAKIL